jgi:hypothetical protein
MKNTESKYQVAAIFHPCQPCDIKRWVIIKVQNKSIIFFATALSKMYTNNPTAFALFAQTE